MDWTLPANFSAQGGGIDELYYIILVVTGIAFVLVEAGILWFLYRYRDSGGREATYTHGSVRTEIVWTAVTAVTVVWLGIHSGQIWEELKGAEAYPETPETVKLDVTARQFEWMITYPGQDGELGTDDDFTDRNRLHLPLGRPVVVRLRSEDVIHSFFIPKLRVKQDVVPGMVNRVWFEARKPGEVELGCAELCGLGHYRMRASVTIHPEGEYREWHDRRSREAAGT